MVASLRRREQDLRAAVPVGPARGRAVPAGHARRAAARRRRRDRGVLHADRLRHGGRRRQGDPRDRRPALRAGARDPRRLRDRQGVEGRPLGQPRVPQDVAQLQPAVRARPARSPSSRSSSWSRSASSIPIRSTCRRSTCSGSSRAPSYEKPIEQRTIAGARRMSHAASRSRADGPPRRRASCATASTSTSASACRRWSPTSSPRHRRRAAVRERPARHRPVPLRGRRGPRPDQRRQADRHDDHGLGVLRLGAVVRDDPRRPRRRQRPRRDGGLGAAATSRTG